MTVLSADITRAWVHGSQGLKAVAQKASLEPDTAWLDLYAIKNNVLVATIFLPFEIAELYANAINACNDREVAIAHEDTCSNS